MATAAYIRVFDHDTRESIAGADVILAGQAAKSDDHGSSYFPLATPAEYAYSVSKSGYFPAQGTAKFGEYANIYDVTLRKEIAAPPPSTPPPEMEGEKIGTSCVLRQFGIEGSGVRFEIRHATAGRIFQSESYSEAKAWGNADPRCNEPTPPTPGPGISPEISDQLRKVEDRLGDRLREATDGIGEQIRDLVTRAEEEATAWRAAFDGIFARIEEWLLGRILSILLRALDREVDERNR